MNKGDIGAALKNIEYVFHFVSTTTPASAENDPLLDINTNVHMSIELLQACVENNVKRVLFASTGGAIYGNGISPRSEIDLPQPISPYGIGKLTIEHYLRYFRVKHGLDSIALRISNPYGPRQPVHKKQGVIPIFLDAIDREQPVTVLGDGSMVRDYVYVKDVADVVADMFNKTVEFDTYNLGTGKGVAVSDLVKTIEKVTEKTATLQYAPAPATFVKEIVLNTDRYTAEFGRVEFTELEDGISSTYKYRESEITE
jgi:UDP-glucose 4-epimerase